LLPQKIKRSELFSSSLVSMNNRRENERIFAEFAEAYGQAFPVPDPEPRYERETNGSREREGGVRERRGALIKEKLADCAPFKTSSRRPA